MNHAKTCYVDGALFPSIAAARAYVGAVGRHREGFSEALEAGQVFRGFVLSLHAPPKKAPATVKIEEDKERGIGCPLMRNPITQGLGVWRH